MKKITLILGLTLFVFAANAQKITADKVPAPVKTAFEAKYPNVKVEKWENEKGNFEAEFDLNKIDNAVVFDKDGNILETETTIKVTELPVGVLDYVKTHYVGQKIKEAAKLTDAKGTVTYEAEVKGIDVIFDNTGNFLKEVKD